jgi:cell wall-associated NlpC family hydrolase
MPREAPGGYSKSTFTSEMIRNAQIIISVGRAVGASARDIQIALATAMQESSLQNLNYGTGASLGLFQQTPPWGSRQERMDPYKSARMFFLGGSDPGALGLLDDHWRQHQSLTEAAQWVQKSAHPDAYAQYAGGAAYLLRTYGDNIKGAHFATTQGDVSQGAPGTPGQPTPKPKEAPAQTFSPVATPENPELGTDIPPEIYTDWNPTDWALPQLSPQEFASNFPWTVKGGRGASVLTGGSIRAQIVQQAMTRLGEPYVWGALDCSGLVQQTFSALGYELPRVSYAQANSGKRVSISALQPGDLVAWDNSSRNNGADHIAIYAGNGYIIEAPRTGLNVRKRKLGSNEGSMWGVSLASMLG